jgi:mannose-6-phosphate isomerase-like protein (cupin superfamily)
MLHANLEFQSDFRVALSNAQGQAAEMVLASGESTGGPDNRHRGSDQWLFVVSGSGEAVVNDQRHPLRRHGLLLIQRGETHEIRNTGDEPLRTLNFYVPPAYTKDGEALPAGKK